MASPKASHVGSLGNQSSARDSSGDGSTIFTAVSPLSLPPRSPSSQEIDTHTSEDSKPESLSSQFPSSSPTLDSAFSPALSRIIDLLTNKYSRYAHWSEHHLNYPDYERLETLRKGGKFGGKRLRYDYSAADEILAIRMPNYETHEVLLGNVSFHIETLLHKTALEKRSPCSFAGSIVARRSSTIEYDHPFSKRQKIVQRDPDYSWRAKHQHYPSFILEIAHSQTTKSLEKLALEYITGTGAVVRTVVGFDLDSKSKEAKVSIWRPEINEQEQVAGVKCETQEIRDKHGRKNADEKARLRLTLDDFAYPGCEIEYPGLKDVEIFIEISLLCQMLEEAEEERRLGSGGEGEFHPIPLAPFLLASNQPSHDYALRSRESV